MAAEQPWGSYTLQAYISFGDTLLVGSASDTVGYRVLGANVCARRSSGGPFTMPGDCIADGGIAVGTDALGWGRFVTVGSALYIQSGSANTTGGSANSTVFGNMYGGAGGAVHPAGDNAQDLGLGSFRWRVVFAGTGTINTSDEREKVWRGAATEAELRAARRIIGELGFFRWADAVAGKGEGARLHFGARAQQVWRIMAEEGLVDPISEGRPGRTPYAFLCFDEWEEQPAVAPQEAVFDEHGNLVSPAHDGIPYRPAGNRFGLRLDQLTLFLIAAQEARLAALEAGQ